MIIERPFSHVEIITGKNLSTFKLSPAVRVIIKESKIFLLDDHASRVFEVEYSPCLEKLFQKLEKGKLKKYQILNILKPYFKNNASKILDELIEMGIVW
ncbi:MAG: hypothetical protein QXS48_04620 [Candidatus Aenigmatarchaeota archaeon]